MEFLWEAAYAEAVVEVGGAAHRLDGKVPDIQRAYHA